MYKSKYIMLIAVLVSVVSINCFADQVTLKSGDRLTGKIIKQDTEKIILETDFAGVLTISRSVVEKISFEEKKEEAAVTEVAEAEKTVENKVESGPSAKEQTDTLTPAEKMAAGSSKRQKFAFTKGWDGAANIGFSYTSGNSRTATFTSGIRAERSSEKDKWTTYLNALWNRNRVAGVNLTTSNAIWGGLRYDRNITKKWFVFGSYDFERDRPQLLNFRSVIGGGLGYHAIKNDRTELDLFSGLAWNRTWFIGPNKSSAEFLVGNSLKHKFNDRVKFQQGFTFYPNLSDGGEYRFIFDSTLSADITKRMGWFVTVGNRFNSLPLAGVEKNDFLFATGLKWAFGKK